MVQFKKKPPVFTPGAFFSGADGGGAYYTCNNANIGLQPLLLVLRSPNLLHFAGNDKDNALTDIGDTVSGALKIVGYPN